jgi:aerobic C4-dicarboxylate transport protein
MDEIISTDRPPPARRPFYRVLYVQVIAAILAGGLIGWLSPATGVALQPLGDGFIKLIKMMIAPIIFCTVVAGIAGVKNVEKVGRVGGKALLYFEAVSSLALVIGLTVANVLKPGVGFPTGGADAAKVAQFADKAKEQGTIPFLMNIIPDTVVGAFAKGDILQVLLFAILFGFALMALGEKGRLVRDFIDQVSKAVFAVVGIIMKAAPLGALGAMAFTIGKYGPAALGNLLGLIATFYFTSALFVIVVLGTIAHLVGFSIFRFLAYIKEELLIVLGTSSSESALPSLMAKLEAAGCPKSVVGLVVPTGYSFNLDGTNIYMTLAALFVAQAMNIPLRLEDQLAIVGVAMLTSKGASGVTGAGFVTLAATLSVVPSIPVAGIALIFGVDKFMSECRALTNIIGNGVATIVISAWERELNRAKLASVLHARADVNAVDLMQTAGGK